MKKKITLYQEARTGKTKFLTISVKKDKLITTWGLVDGKTQTTEKTCIPTNVGRSNERDGAAQALFEMEAKVTEKTKEGYREELEELESITSTKLDFDKLPDNFCACKPVSEAPLSVLKAPSTYAQRKHDGHCLLLPRGKKIHMYTRRIEDKTYLLEKYPIINDQANKVPKNSLVLAEFAYERNSSHKEVATDVQSLLGVDDPAEAADRYAELSKAGILRCKVFDILFLNGKFIGNMDYLDRYKILQDLGFDVPEIIYDWRAKEAEAQEKLWEGFVLRVPGDKSFIEYTMDGKARRAGSYKYVFTKTDDFVVTEVLKGKAGKHASLFCKFRVIQYDTNGNTIDRAYVGPGTLTHDQLKELTNELETKKRTCPFVVEIEYKTFHEDSGALQFGQILRIRDDKTPRECVYEG
jgi:ATP-dependent DNA ligase